MLELLATPDPVVTTLDVNSDVTGVKTSIGNLLPEKVKTYLLQF